MVQFVASRAGEQCNFVGCLAGGGGKGVGAPREPGRDRSGAESGASLGGAWDAVRGGCLGAAHGTEALPGLDASFPGPAQEGDAAKCLNETKTPDPFSGPRFDTAAQRELNASVARLGILQPITVRFIQERKIHRIITGQRRLEAAKQANLQEVPCWVQTPEDDEVLLHQIVENWQRADMHPFDLADALSRLRDGNAYTQKQIAEHTGKSEGEISKLLALLHLDPEVQKAAREDATDTITKRHLYAVARLPSQTQRNLIARVQDERLTTIELEHLVRQETGADKHAQRKHPVGRQFRFATSAATVMVTFQKRDVTNAEIAEALEEARKRLTESGGCPSVAVER